MDAQSLVFQNTEFSVVDRNNQPWLRGHQIGVALRYARTDIIQKLYRQHADEFTDSMTAVVKLPTAGGEQETRIFSLRGAHLLAMLSRTPVAKEFRRWVLDILERESAVSPAPTLQKSGLGRSLREEIRQAVAEAVEAELPKLTAPLYSLKNIWAHLSAGNGMYIDSDTLAEIASDCNAKLASRAAFYQQRALAQRH